MRLWRKLYSSILESERFMDLPLEAKVLFFLLVAAQDDTGYYPWERMKVRHLVAACGWSESEATRHAESLARGKMATWKEGGIILHNGAELNGRARGDRTPFSYRRSSDTVIPVTVSDIPTTDIDGPVTVSGPTESRVEKIKEKSREEEIKEEIKAKKPSEKKPWDSPDWFRPLADLSGYTQRDHSRRAELISITCAEVGVDKAELILAFAAYYKAHRHEHGWADPVATLRGRPLSIQIQKLLNSGGRRDGKPWQDTKQRYDDSVANPAEKEKLRKYLAGAATPGSRLPDETPL